jgi:hypothetical protein
MRAHESSTKRGRLGTPLVLAALAIGCGGGCGGGDGPHADTTPARATGGGQADADHSDQVPIEKMDEITRSLERKRPIMSHCLAIAVDNKELPKNSRGKVTLEISIAPNGKADSVKVARASFESKTLTECMIHHIQEIQFPELPRPFGTSYTYGFEAM